jgi:NAD(P)-dependent dehydrogenase (short-subunit alcohol dehydrogenase family)
MKVDLTGRVALVTGAGRGIGKAIADCFATNGARVLYADIDLATATESARQQPGCRSVVMDVTNGQQVESVFDEVVRDFGGLDILVNNAGVNTLDYRVTIDQFPQHEWDRILKVDLTGVYLVSRTASRVMVAQRESRPRRIINITSIAGLVPLRLQCAFVAAKAGVVNLTRAMALELGPRGVLVNAIAPGSTLTDGTRKLFYGEDGKFKESVQRLLDHIPLGRPAQPEEIAHAALFLAAPESSYINGHVLTVDGGWTAGYLREF